MKRGVQAIVNWASTISVVCLFLMILLTVLIAVRVLILEVCFQILLTMMKPEEWTDNLPTILTRGEVFEAHAKVP